jgi:uncharacterized protein (DUF2141 family)
MLRRLLLASLVCLMVPLAAVAESQGKITIRVTGLRNDKGTVRVAMFNSEASYDKSKSSTEQSDGSFRRGLTPISSKSATCVFSKVPYGEYAIKLFHDEDNSGKFVTGVFGIPKVEYGFSNNARGKLGPAAYEKAKFKLDQPELTIDISVHSGI